MSLAIGPFTVAIPEADLDDLANGWRALACSSSCPTRAGTTAPNAATNAFDNFVTEVDGARVHFIHAPSPVATRCR
jgi:hypothetical protein